MPAPLNLGMWTSRPQCVLSSRAELGKGRERPGVCGKWYVEGWFFPRLKGNMKQGQFTWQLYQSGIFASLLSFCSLHVS